MSNHLAIATVTATLGQLVLSAAQASGLSGIALKFGRPTPPTPAGERKVHVYLYQVSPNAALRNADLPTRDGRHTPVRVPRAALDLYYLISFFGDDADLEPERMLGAAIRELHAQPLLTPGAIADAVVSYPALAGSNLAAAVEQVRVTPVTLTLDEMSRLWSVMTQTPHTVSVAYQATVVVIEPEATVSRPAPVLTIGPRPRGADVQVESYPVIAGFWIGAPQTFDQGARRPPSFPAARLGTRLAIRATHVGGDSLAIRFEHARRGPFEVAIPPSQQTPEEVFADLTAATAGGTGWAAGVYQVTLVVTRGGRRYQSAAVPLALAPRIVSILPAPAARDAAGRVVLTVATEPPLRTGQVPRLLVAALDAAGPAAAADQTDVVFDVPDAPALTAAIARLRVQDPGGAGSAPTMVESMPFRYDPATGTFGFDDSQRVTIT
jgi:hypothetical protein